MARTYARVLTAIWSNSGFLALPGNAKLLYLLLASQSDISAVGTLPLTVRRWTNMIPDWQAGTTAMALEQLEAGRFIVVDADTEELLVRSFVRHDGGHGNGKRLQVIRKDALGVTSVKIRLAIMREFDRLGVTCDALSDGASHAASEAAPDAPSDGSSTVESLAEQAEAPESLFPLVDSPSDSASYGPSDGACQKSGVAVGYVSSQEPQPTTHNPETATLRPSAAQSAPTVNQRAQELAKRYHAIEPMVNFPAVLQVAKKAISTGKYTDEQIGPALEQLAREGRSVTTESLRVQLDGRPPLRAVSGGHQPFRNPTDQSVYEESL